MVRIFVAGHRGMVGKAICRKLAINDSVEIVTRDRDELDLLSQNEVQAFFKSEKLDEVVIAAAKVGGILANQTYKAQFIYENLQIQNNVIHSAHTAGVQKLLFLGSSCIYPRAASQPINEDSLLSGRLETTNEPYAIAKIAGIKMCESYSFQYGRDYRSVMPTNLYGPGDNYDLETSHVVPALIRKFHEARTTGKNTVVVWGTGKPRRELLFVDDMADAALFFHWLPKEVYEKSNTSQPSHVNIGTGQDVSIMELAAAIKEITKFEGDIVLDTSKPDGTERKLLDVSKMDALGWSSVTPLSVGLQKTYQDFLTLNLGN